MPTTLNFKDIANAPVWRPEAPLIAATAAGGCITYDMRNDIYRNPYIYHLRSATAFDAFNTLTGDWMPLASPALAGTFGAGAFALYHASAGPRGTLAAGSTTTVINITTALPASVGVNQLANNGHGIGFRIRIIGGGTASSGKIEERTIIANTSGTTPVITLDSALSFTPVATDTYEIVSGRVFLLSAGTLAAGVWKHYDVATNSYSGNLTTTNLPATIGTDSVGVALSEVYVPNDRVAGSGMLNGGSTYNAAATIECILASAATSTTITGSGMPSTLATNEYRNFQIRIVEDTTNTTAVGQRRNITSHTSGATGVFTVPTWTVTPSATAKFVVEYNDDLIILRSSASTSFFTYSISGNAWSTSTFTAGGSANGAGCFMAQSFGITRDTTGNTRHSFIYLGRGAAANTIDVLDIAGGTNGSVSAAIVYHGLSQTFTTGTSACYDPATLGGRYVYLNINGTQRFARFDIRHRRMEPSTYLRFPQGAALVGSKMACALLVDGSTKLNFVYHATHTQTQFESFVSAV